MQSTLLLSIICSLALVLAFPVTPLIMREMAFTRYQNNPASTANELPDHVIAGIKQHDRKVADSDAMADSLAFLKTGDALRDIEGRRAAYGVSSGGAKAFAQKEVKDVVKEAFEVISKVVPK